MTDFSKIERKFRFLTEYDAKKGGQLLNEALAHFAYSDFTIIGKVVPPFEIRNWGQDDEGHWYTPVGQDYLYIWADMGRNNPANWGRMGKPTPRQLKNDSIGLSIMVNLRIDDGRIHPLNDPINDCSNLSADYFHLYPEFKDTIYGELYGDTQENLTNKQHEEIMGNLDIRGGKLILKHNSPVKIMDGVISGRGRQIYSSNTDYQNYYWASKDIGPDPSGSGRYMYFCEVDPNDFYDCSSDLEHFGSIPEAMKHYKYVGVRWKDSNRFIAAVGESAPISWVVDKDDNLQKYDAKWNKISG